MNAAPRKFSGICVAIGVIVCTQPAHGQSQKTTTGTPPAAKPASERDDSFALGQQREGETIEQFKDRLIDTVRRHVTDYRRENFGGMTSHVLPPPNPGDAALAALVRTWGKEEWLKELLMSLLKEEDNAVGVRKRALGYLTQLGANEGQLKKLLVTIAKSREEESDGLIAQSLRTMAVSAVVRIWGKEEWLRELLMQLAGKEEKPGFVRLEACRSLTRLWGKEAWVREQLVACAEPQNPDRIRHSAIESLIQLWGKDEFVKDALVPLLKAEEKSEYLRDLALCTLSEKWGREEWLKKLLLPLTYPEEKKLRERAIREIVRVWGSEDWVKTILVSLTDRKQDGNTPGVRWTAIELLGKYWHKEQWLKELLVPLVSSDEKDTNVRAAAINALGESWGREEWLKKLLRPISKSEKNNEVRWAAKANLKRLWPELYQP